MRGARLRKGGGARDAERDLRFRLEHTAGALRRARIGRATHGRGWQAVRDPFRTATADRVEWPVPVSRRWWQRWRRRPGCRAQHGIVSRDRLAARLRRGDNGRGPSGPDARVRSGSIARVDHAYAAHERDRDDRVLDRRALLRPRSRSQVLRRLLRRRAAGHDVRPALPRVLRWHRDLRARDERLERRDNRGSVGHTDLSLDCSRERGRAARPESGTQRFRSVARCTQHHDGVRCRRWRNGRNGAATRGVSFRSKASAVRCGEGREHA